MRCPGRDRDFSRAGSDCGGDAIKGELDRSQGDVEVFCVAGVEVWKAVEGCAGREVELDVEGGVRKSGGGEGGEGAGGVRFVGNGGERAGVCSMGLGVSYVWFEDEERNSPFAHGCCE